jgi:acetyltransferase
MRPHIPPGDLVRIETLRDGGVVLLRPIRPEDAAIELDFVARQSDDSRYMRFFSPIKTLTPRMLARFTQLDPEQELALLATVGAGAEESIVGVARYSPNADGESAEFAVAVDDRWHGRGLGALLMQRLMQAARAAGYQRLTGAVLASNQKMHKLMHALGFVVASAGRDPGVNEYSIDLAAPPTSATPTGPDL